MRRKTCALLRAKTSAVLRRKTCAVLRARTCALFRANTKETTEGGGRRPPPFVELLGVTLCRLGEPWVPSWADVGVIWGRLGVPLEPLGLSWGALGSSCRCRGSVWAAWGGHAAETPCLCIKYGLLEPRNPRNPQKWCQEVLLRPLLPRAPVGQDDVSLSKLPQMIGGLSSVCSRRT